MTNVYYEFTNKENIPAVIEKDGFCTPVWIQKYWQGGEFEEFVHKNGCGHCCTAMALRLHGIDIDPHREFALCRQLWGEPIRPQGNYMSVSGIAKILMHFGITADAFGISDAKESAEHIYNELSAGNLVIIWSRPDERLEPNPFSTGNHYVLAVGINDDGIVIANSSTKGITKDGIQISDLQTIEKTLYIGADPHDNTWGAQPHINSGGYVVISK